MSDGNWTDAIDGVTHFEEEDRERAMTRLTDRIADQALEIADLRAKLAAAEAREAVMLNLVDVLIAASTQSRAVLNDAVVLAKVAMGGKAASELIAALSPSPRPAEGG